LGALISNRLISEGSTDGITAPADSDELTKLLNQFVIRSTTTTRAGHVRSSAAGGREGTIVPRWWVIKQSWWWAGGGGGRISIRRASRLQQASGFSIPCDADILPRQQASRAAHLVLVGLRSNMMRNAVGDDLGCGSGLCQNARGTGRHAARAREANC
jgi:hypothetical protein